MVAVDAHNHQLFELHRHLSVQWNDYIITSQSWSCVCFTQMTVLKMTNLWESKLLQLHQCLTFSLSCLKRSKWRGYTATVSVRIWFTPWYLSLFDFQLNVLFKCETMSTVYETLHVTSFPWHILTFDLMTYRDFHAPELSSHLASHLQGNFGSHSHECLRSAEGTGHHALTGSWAVHTEVLLDTVVLVLSVAE